MQSEYLIIEQVYAAKESMQAADELIRAYLPFIRSETSKFFSRPCTEQDDEFSIAMIAFHEAIRGYEKNRGAFFAYASMMIRSRLIDYQRKESRHYGHLSLDEKKDEDGKTLMDTIASDDTVDDFVSLEATKQEIEELASVMKEYGIGFSDVSENSPKQERTLEACKKAIQFAADNKQILDELLRTKKLPLARLVEGSGADRKTLERHRKYILAMLLIQTNGYEIIRGHLRHLLKKKGGNLA